MSVATYTMAPPTRPAITHDNGFLDVCTPRSAGVTDYLMLGAWELAYRGADTVAFSELPDALAAYNHFLHGNGADRTFSYERYVSNDANGRVTLENAIADAREGAESLVRSRWSGEVNTTFQMTGTAIPCGSGSLFPYPATQNWQKAIGAHIIWLSAEVTVRTEGGQQRYSMELTLHAEDRYNFNPGANDIATGLPDQLNGELECSGLGHQYMNNATLTRSVEWTAAASHGPSVSGDWNPIRSHLDRPAPRERRTPLVRTRR